MQGRTPFLIDFGIAKTFDFKRSQDTHCIGTVGYASPEHYKGHTDNRSDIFSLGRLLFHLLTGKEPANFHFTKPLDHPSLFNSTIPHELDSIIIKACHPEPRYRHQTVKGLKGELEKIYLVKRNYEKCVSCGSALLEGHYFCSSCGSLKKIPDILLSGISNITIKENTKIQKVIKNGITGAYTYGENYYKAEYFGRTLGFDTLITIEHNKIEEMPHQLKVIKRVLKNMRGRALLADEVGLGKTIEAGVIMEELKARGLVRRVLIILPSHISDQWKDEMKEKFNRDFLIFKASDYNPKILETEPFVIISIDSATRNNAIKENLVKQKWDMIIVDEAHYAKNRNTKRWKFLSSLSKSYILLLTATPLHNNLLELFNLITLIRPGHLKDEKDFISTYVDKADPRKPKNVHDLKKLLSDVMVRTRRSSALVKFPQREARTIKITPSTEEYQLYREVTTFIKSLGNYNKQNYKLPLMVLQQRLTSSPVAVAESINNFKNSNSLMFRSADLNKLDDFYKRAKAIKDPAKALKLIKLIKDLKKKVVVFTDHVPTQNYLLNFLNTSGVKSSLYKGTHQEKMKSLKNFSADSIVLIVSKAGAEGLNLHHYSNIVVNYDLPWNPMRLEQRIGRLQRIGQKKKVLVYNLALEGTIEDIVLDILEKKVKLFELAIGQIDLILGICFEDKDFDDLIWKSLMDADTEKDVRENLNKNVEEVMVEGVLKVQGIDICNQFLPVLDDGL
jgi:SNF2 family DNA or RNA helicase